MASVRGEALRLREMCDLNPLLPQEALLFSVFFRKRGLPSLRVSPGLVAAPDS